MVPSARSISTVWPGRSVPSPAKAAAVRLSWEGPESPARFRWVAKPELDAPSPDAYAIG